jgi:membrane-associated protease RseP (regulator of RpoE activity)
MSRILLTGTAVLALINAGLPASAAHKHAMRYQQPPVQQQWFGSGAYVEGVDPDSAAERAGLRPGDRIIGINGRPINNNSDVDPFVAASGGRPLTLDVARGGTRVRLRAAPRFGLAPTSYGGVERRRMLGYSYTKFCFGCGGSDYVEPPPKPNPPAPDIPQPLLQPPMPN